MVTPLPHRFVPHDGDDEWTLTPEERTLRERARRLAAEPPEEYARADAAGTEVLLCRLHGERYALEMALLRAVLPARGLAPIPCTPAFVAGMLNVRGTVVAVLDLAHLLGLAGAPPPEEAVVLLADSPGAGQGPVGLLVHEVLGGSRLPLDGLNRSLSGISAVRGIAEGGIVVLDLAALLADSRIEVAEEW